MIAVRPLMNIEGIANGPSSWPCRLAAGAPRSAGHLRQGQVVQVGNGKSSNKIVGCRGGTIEAAVGAGCGGEMALTVATAGAAKVLERARSG